ncbi:MAG: methyltransferase domain-containing protein [Lentisphaerae bacterium]|nr:methyltransferase domain-containing protein [Lentisphaerota bacterium]
MREIASCEACGNASLDAVLDLGPQPMCDDLVAFGEDRVCAEYPVEILFCPVCRTCHQRFQVPKKVLFPKTYHYRARFTADVLNGMTQLVDACVSRLGDLSGLTVVDVGCNDGCLLDRFRDRGAATVGIEPTNAAVDAQQKGHRVFNSYLDSTIAQQVVAACGFPAVITFTNVFAHIENLAELLDSLKGMLAPSTVIVIENHYLGSVLEGGQFDTFYHEHPRTYSYTSFTHIAKAMGLSVLGLEFPARYGGNIRVFLGNPEDRRPEDEECQAQTLAREAGFADSLAAFQRKVDTWREEMGGLLAARVAERGSLKAKAFPGRAAILVKLLQLDTGTLSAVYEKPGSLKIGHYVPGTRIPIHSDEDLRPLSEERGPLVNLAWHISKEIRNYLAADGYRGEIIDILGPQYLGTD